MSRLTSALVAVGVAIALAASGSWADEAPAALSAKLDASGLIQLTRGDAQLATIELNAHGADWKHAPQATATAQVSALPNGTDKRFVGTLPIPNADGAIRYTETVKLLPQGLRLEYDLGVTKAMKLDGLQLSVNLPVAAYAGKPLLIGQGQGEPQGVTLPPEKQDKPDQAPVQLWAGEGAKVEVAKGTEEALTVELLAPTDLVVQDLRKWGTSVFEIRFPAIMEDPGRDVAADDRFHLDLTVTFAGPVKLEGP